MLPERAVQPRAHVGPHELRVGVELDVEAAKVRGTVGEADLVEVSGDARDGRAEDVAPA